MLINIHAHMPFRKLAGQFSFRFLTI